MTVSAAVAPASTDTSATSGSRTRLAENFDTFLTLLTTQLKNQDPLAPMDSNAFTQQMVQMTGVEQQLLTNDLLTKLVGNSSSGISTAVSLIGKQVRAVSDAAALTNDGAKWTYKLDSAADDLKVEVLDAKKNVVRVIAPEAAGKTAGDHDFTWDGKDASGHRLPNGTYTLRVTAKDATGTVIPSTTYVQGVVSGVEQADGDTLLTINGGQVSWQTLTTITQAAAAPPTTTPPPGTGTTTAPADDPTNPAG
jgi:flagellar basal-body rod modification protein FlgD